MTSSSQTLSHISSLNTSDVKAPPPSVFPLLSSLSHTQAPRPKQVGGRGPEIAPIAWGKPEVGRALVSETLKLENPTFFFPAAQLFSNYLMQCWINAERTQLFQQQHHDRFWGGAHYAKPCCSRHMAHCFRRAAPSFLPGKYESIFKSFCIEWKHKKHTGFEYDFFYTDHGKTSFGDFGAHLIVHCTSELFLTCYLVISSSYLFWVIN